MIPLFSHESGIPWPFTNLPLPDEPVQDLHLANTLPPLLQQIQRITKVAIEADPDALAPADLQEVEWVHHTVAAATYILDRWWDASAVPMPGDFTLPDAVAPARSSPEEAPRQTPAKRR